MQLHKKSVFIIGFSFLGFSQLNGQTQDSVTRIDEVVIQSFKRTLPFIQSTSSVAHINSGLLNVNPPERIMESVNMIPGAKMEERSPGSYRVSLRGSTLRSPFGVRNVKIYFDDFILSDASGNSYLNIIDPSFIQSIDILKGPQGGELGAETGGGIVLHSGNREELSLDLSAGSYGLFSEKFAFSKQLGKHFLKIGQAHHQSDSYRAQSAIRRDAFFIKDEWNYAKNNTLNATILFTDLHYETPGGLNAAQMETDRRQARLATATLPSAIEQQAGIYNNTFLGGLSHTWRINENWSQFMLVQTSSTDFENPFITNYELRDEKNTQARFYINYDKTLSHVDLQTRAGFEMGRSSTDFKNYDNLRGEVGPAQEFADFTVSSAYYYLMQHISFYNKLFVDASISYHAGKSDWSSISYGDVGANRVELGNDAGGIKMKNQWLPSFAATYQFDPTFSIRAKVAKGISTPTTEELRAAFSSSLAPEYGWNKEFGIRKRLGSIFIESTIFDYNLNDAIMRGQYEDGEEYYENIGKTKQLGVELLVESDRYKFNNEILNGIKFIVSGNYYDFKFDADEQMYNLIAGPSARYTPTYKGNRLPGIPKWSLQSIVTFDLVNHFSLDYVNYFNSSQYLKSDNTLKEDGFVISNLKLNAKFRFDKYAIGCYVGVNNLYNEEYSAGYDLNAFGNRFYNPAALRNFYVGVKVSL